MIREGILDSITEMYSQFKDDIKNTLPSFDYIKSRLSLPKTESPSKNNMENSESSRNRSPVKGQKQQMKDIVEDIKTMLESIQYDFESLHELKRISKVLRNPHSSVQLCKEALGRLGDLLVKQGMTLYEVIQSNIIESLHVFLLEIDEDEDTTDKSLWNRIHMFISEIAEDHNCIAPLIESLHNVINNDALTEELHITNTASHSFYVRSRFYETEHVKLVCEYQSLIVKHEKPVMDSFFRSMSKFEEGEENDSFFNRKSPQRQSQPQISEALRAKDQVYQKLQRFTILVPTNISLKKLCKTIKEYLQNKDANELTLQRTGQPNNFGRILDSSIQQSLPFRQLGISQRRFFDSLKVLDQNLSSRFQNIREMEIEEEDDDSDDMDLPPPPRVEDKNKVDIKLLPDDEETELDMHETVEDWIKRRCKQFRPQKSYLRIFRKDA